MADELWSGAGPALQLAIPLTIAMILVAAFALRARVLARRLANLEAARSTDRVLAMLQQEIDGLRHQVSVAVRVGARDVGARLDSLSTAVDQRLHQGVEMTQRAHQVLGERLDHTARVVGAVERSLGGLEEANRRILEIGRDIASLQEILRPPKLRGGLGETLLEDLLRQVLPAANISFQYGFRDGARVDAIIRLEGGFVPVDAKFPLENFRRCLAAGDEAERGKARRAFVLDVRRHIDAIAARYIRPDEGTFDFALMYVPAENVYYEIVVKDDIGPDTHIAEYALHRRVIPVSPGSFYAYLQAIAVGLRGMRIEQRAGEIMKQLSMLRADVDRLRDAQKLVGRHLNNALSGFAAVEKRLDRLDARLSHMAGEDAMGESGNEQGGLRGEGDGR